MARLGRPPKGTARKPSADLPQQKPSSDPDLLVMPVKLDENSIPALAKKILANRLLLREIGKQIGMVQPELFAILQEGAEEGKARLAEIRDVCSRSDVEYHMRRLQGA